MSARLSTRLSIRWVPGEPSEPTDTLVMSVGGWYVDLRITKADGTIDWAMAGERLILSQHPLTCKWTHWIDSKGYTEPDVGSFQEDSGSTDSVETGKMVNPDTGLETPYEEVWRVLPATYPTRFPRAWVLRSVDGKTFLGRVGGDLIALRGGSDDPTGQQGFCARREKWHESASRWVTTYEAGALENLGHLPSYQHHSHENDNKWEDGCKSGDRVNVFGTDFVVCAIERLA